MLLPQLRRVRWAVRATLVLGVAASVVANVLHALDNPISQAIAAWPPLALLLTVELISRVPVYHKSLAVCRLLATATIAGIAAWVSYWHMAGVAARYGETGASPYLLPLSVDGLIVVASICLVELGSRITTLQAEAQAPVAAPSYDARPAPGLPAATTRPVAIKPVAAPRQPPAVPVPGLVPIPAKSEASRRSSTAAALAEVAAALTRAEATPPGTPAVTRGPRAATPPARKSTAAAAGPATTSQVTKSVAGSKPRRSPAETVAEAAKIKQARPDITEPDLASELGITVARWRTVRRDAEAQGENLRLAA